MNQELKQALATVRKLLGSELGRAALSTIEEALEEEHDLRVMAERHACTMSKLSGGLPQALDVALGKIARGATCPVCAGTNTFVDSSGHYRLCEQADCQAFLALSDAARKLRDEPAAPPVEAPFVTLCAGTEEALWEESRLAAERADRPQPGCNCACHGTHGMKGCSLCCRVDPHTGKPVEAPPAESAVKAIESVLSSFGAPDLREPCCWSCTPDYRLMLLCATCGNKRCPKANDHRNVCSNSNEPGQPGSAYPSAAPPSPPEAEPHTCLLRPDDVSGYCEGCDAEYKAACEPVAQAERGKP